MMKKILLLIIISVPVLSVNAQNVGIGTTTPQASAQLDVSSSDKGFLPPRMTTSERNAIANKAAGLMIFNTSTSCIEVYNGANWINLCSSLPSSEITHTLIGGNQDDFAYHIRQTSDGGYIIGGTSASSQNGDATPENHGGSDCWVVKLSAGGNIEWNKMYGGSADDELRQIVPTSDGGYIFCAYTESSADGDVWQTSHGGFDSWIVKLDASGDTTWTKLIGGDQGDFANSIQQTADGGYVVAAFSFSSDIGDITDPSNGLSDYWVVKLNASGTIVWDKLLGGAGEEQVYAVRQAADGGYIVSGYSTSSASGNVTGTIHGVFDFWVVKLTGTGTISWNTLIGGTQEQIASNIEQTADGGYITIGKTLSGASGNITGTNHGQNDFLIVKLNSSGAVSWTQILGGAGEDFAASLKQTSDGGYIVAGTSSSSATGNVSDASHGLEDAWIVKLNSTGNITWNKLFGGTDSDFATSIQITTDGNYIISGYTMSSASGTVIGTNHGANDYWVLKLDENGNIL